MLAWLKDVYKRQELEYMIAEPRKEFMIMVVFVVGNIPLMYLLNQDWYDVLMHTVLGQCILAATAAAIFISAGFVVKLTRPIEYRRYLWKACYFYSGCF